MEPTCGNCEKSCIIVGRKPKTLCVLYRNTKKKKGEGLNVQVRLQAVFACTQPHHPGSIGAYSSITYLPRPQFHDVKNHVYELCSPYTSGHIENECIALSSCLPDNVGEDFQIHKAVDMPTQRGVSGYRRIASVTLMWI